MKPSKELVRQQKIKFCECGHALYFHTTHSMYGRCCFADCQCNLFILAKYVGKEQG
jgi:hypothetical protein